MPKLKVFRTAIGFHDAYVAAPSMKAALAAWGAGSNLFAQGLAEVVDDARLTQVPLADPGKVIKVVRGTDAEHFAALGKTPAPRKGKRADVPSAKPGEIAKPPKPKSRPSRAKLDAAEAALVETQAVHRQAVAGLSQQEAALRAQRRRLEAVQEAEATKLQTRIDRAEADYEKAMGRWRE